MSDTRTDVCGDAAARLLAALLAYFAVGSGCLRVLGGDAATAGVETLSLVHGAGSLGFCLVALSLPSTARLTPRAAAPAIGSYLVFMSAWVPLALFAYPWSLRSLGIEFAAQPSLAYFSAPSFDRWQFYAVLITTTLISPLAEELCFRGHLRDLLRGLLGATPAWLVGAALFGLMHGATFALPLFALGLLFGWLRERHAGLFAPFLVHALQNTLTAGVVLAWPTSLTWVYSR